MTWSQFDNRIQRWFGRSKTEVSHHQHVKAACRAEILPRRSESRILLNLTKSDQENQTTFVLHWVNKVIKLVFILYNRESSIQKVYGCISLFNKNNNVSCFPKMRQERPGLAGPKLLILHSLLITFFIFYFSTKVLAISYTFPLSRHNSSSGHREVFTGFVSIVCLGG